MKKATKKATPKINTQGLVEQGNNALSNLQPELAMKFFERALSMSAQDTNIMDALADVYLQLDHQDKALRLLLMSTSLAPEANPFKWLYLAQLQDGEGSKITYLKAIGILKKMIANNSSANDKIVNNTMNNDDTASSNNGNNTASDFDVSIWNKQIAKAYCSICELYLTDLCYEDQAEVSMGIYMFM